MATAHDRDLCQDGPAPPASGRAYGRICALMFFLVAGSIAGDLLLTTLLSVLAAHFFTRSIPWAIRKIASTVATVSKGKSRGTFPRGVQKATKAALERY